jgi:hypothetical protein
MLFKLPSGASEIAVGVRRASLGSLVPSIVLGRLLIHARLRVGSAQTAAHADDHTEVFAAHRLVVEDGDFGAVGAELVCFAAEPRYSANEQKRCAKSD